ncbi:hypothetical protein HYU23_04020 [Candidatus Woesearchaeota archaeon]|nr:hypothetical protein [Candidatus Woesearchaeota archaeon]
MGLERVVESVINLHNSRFDRQIWAKGVTLNIGVYYELLSQGFYGGYLVGEPMYVLKRTRNGNGKPHVITQELWDTTEYENQRIESRVTYKFYPDIYNDETNIMTECKGIGGTNNNLRLTQSQVDSYRAFQVGKPIPKIRFLIYRHGLPKEVSKWRGPVKDLFRDLSEKTIYCASFPLSVLLNIIKYSKVSQFTTEEGGYLVDRLSIRGNLFDALLQDPEDLFRRLKLNLDNFHVRRYLSPLDYNLAIEPSPKLPKYVYPVRQFPILQIEDRDHESWSREFIREYLTSERGMDAKDVTQYLQDLDRIDDIPF